MGVEESERRGTVKREKNIVRKEWEERERQSDRRERRGRGREK